MGSRHLMWDNISAAHNAIADYMPQKHWDMAQMMAPPNYPAPVA
jgi:hypothetical protein